MKIKLLEDWGEFGKGDAITLDDEATAKELIAQGLAEAFDPIEAGKAQAAARQQAKADRQEVVKEVIDALKEEAKTGDSPIFTHDKSDDDTTHGYCPNGSKASKGEKVIGMGKFACDVAALKMDGVASERLVKMRQRTEEQLKAAKAAGDVMNVGTDSEGGILLPSGFSLELLQPQRYMPIVEPRAMRVNMDTLTMDLPVIQDDDRSNGTVFGNVQALWLEENATITESSPKFSNRSLKLKPLAAFLKASHMAVKFSPMAVGSMLTGMGGDAIAWAKDSAYLFGTGAGKPLGMFESGAKLAISKEDGQEANTIVLENTVKQLARFRGLVGPSSAVWLANQTVLPQLLLLNVSVGTGGAPVFIQNNNAAGAPQQNLWGFPISYSEKAKALGTEADLSLVDLARYLFAVGGATEIAESIHLDFDTGKHAFRLIAYADGQPMDDSVYRPENGDTLSGFVTIETRS
jgi:HK97 family phage major capsid protein